MRTSVLATSTYRLRLTLGFALVIVALTAAWVWSLYAPLDAAVRLQQQTRLENRAQAVAALARSSVPLSQQLAGIAEGDMRITILTEDGRVLADSQEGATDTENHGGRPEVRDAFAGRTGADIRRSDNDDVERLYVAVPGSTVDGRPIVVRTSEPVEEIAALAAPARRSGLFLLPAVVLIAIAAAWAVTQAIARPVEDLARAARAMAAGDLAFPVPVRPELLRPLSGALTSLREQLRARLSALEAERETLRIALDGLSEGVLLLDGDKVRLANRALGGMFRLPPGGLVGKPVGQLGLPAPIEAVIVAGFGETSPAAVDLGPDPFQRYHRVLMVPLGADGALRTLVVIADESDRLRLDAVRRDFVANASHELKTPVAGIALLAESAEQAARNGETGQSLVFLDQLAGETARLRRLVADLLDLSRLESVPGTGEVADVRRAVELALAGHRRAANEKGLAMRADLDAVAGTDVVALSATSDLAVALDNLLSNAIAYTERGEVVVRVRADDIAVSVAVSDTGIGIPAEDVERVFERFYRVDRARSRTSGGTGLGLALVKNVAERAGGDVSIASALGAGTTVTLRLPRVR